MNRYHLWLLFVLISTQLVGCANRTTTQPSAPVIEKSESSAPKASVTVPEPAVIAPAVTPPVPTTKVVPPAPTSNAVTSLVAQARGQYAAKNYQAAIATAERGLRIDRRSAELYLVLAQSYGQLANTQLATQFVQQGIRYAQAGSDIAQSLMKVRDSLPKQ